MKFDFGNKPLLEDHPITTKNAWLDVSDIARGVGFTETVHLSIALNDAWEPRRETRESDYDQLSYDALWLAHLKLSLNQGQSATFNFVFPSCNWKTGMICTTSLRLRVEDHRQDVLLGLLPDFPEETWMNP